MNKILLILLFASTASYAAGNIVITGGGSSGDITSVAVSGEALAGGGTSGAVTVVGVSTISLTTKNETISAPKTHTSSITVNSTILATDGLVSGSLSVPNGANPTIDGAGEIAIDTTDGVLVAYDGSGAAVIAASTNSATVTISSGTGYNGLSIPVWRAPTDMAVTVTKIVAESLPAGTTVLYQLNERAFGSINSAGSNVFSVSFSTANDVGVTTTSFSDASLAAQASLVMTTPTTSAGAGSPSLMTFTIYYVRQRE